MADVWAHTSSIVADKETLDEHSRAVASQARRLGAKFGAGDLAFAAGMLHDLGKAKPAFQAYLRKERGSAPHSADGALYAVKAFDGAKTLDEGGERRLGRVLAFAIAGHHAGLANGLNYGAGTLPLRERLELANAEAQTPAPWFEPSELAFTEWPTILPSRPGKSAFAWSFFIRMLFSTLVDADFIETERWFAKVEGGEAIPRGWTGPANGSLEPLRDALDRRLHEFSAPESDIDHLRTEVLADCRAAAISNATGCPAPLILSHYATAKGGVRDGSETVFG